MILLVPTTPSVVKRWLVDFEEFKEIKWIISGRLFSNFDCKYELSCGNYHVTKIQNIYEKYSNQTILKPVFFALVLLYALVFIKFNDITKVIVSNDLCFLQRGFSAASSILGIEVIFKQAAAIQSIAAFNVKKKDISTPKNRFILTYHRMTTRSIAKYSDKVLVWNDYFKKVIGHEKAEIVPGNWFSKSIACVPEVMFPCLRKESVVIYTQPFSIQNIKFSEWM